MVLMGAFCVDNPPALFHAVTVASIQADSRTVLYIVDCNDSSG